jgi:tetratricopeptide (TPR) repeat protein
MKTFCSLLLILLPTLALAALPKERKDVRAGNKAYEKKDYAAAEIEYLRALDKVPNSTNAKYNLANALYKQLDSASTQDAEAAKKQLEKIRSMYDEVAETSASDAQKAEAYYNAGNTYLLEQDFKQAVEAYKKSLRLNPSDLQAKQNLVFAQAMSNQQPPQQQQNQDQNQDQKQDKNQDQKQDKEQDKNQDKKQDQQQQNQDQKQNQDKQNQGEQQEQEAKISKEDAQRMLQALEQQEKDTQEKVKKEKAKKAQQRSTGKNW